MRFFIAVTYFMGCRLLLLSFNGYAQLGTIQPNKTLTVYDGLPQSYVSGIQQDKQGFIWIGTRDGLARYDGRKFKTFRHDRHDPTSPAGNIVNSLYKVGKGRLWITYETGEVDLLQTETGQITHLSALPHYAMVKDTRKQSNHVVEDIFGRYWVPDEKGGIAILNTDKKQAAYYVLSSLFPQLGESHITGIAIRGKWTLLVLEHSMIYVDQYFHVVKHIPFTFPDAQLFNPTILWKDCSPFIRNNGDILIPDDGRLILYQQASQRFRIYPLPIQKYYINPHFIADTAGDVLLAYYNMIYRFSKDNQLSLLDGKPGEESSFKTALCLDQSGVLWIGTNGYGIQLYDVFLKQMTKLSYVSNFPFAILQMLGLSEKAIEKTFLYHVNPYFFRWTSDNDGRIWMSKAGADAVIQPNLLSYGQGYVRKEHYVYRDSIPNPEGHMGLDALAVSRSGKLWAIDHLFRPISFDTSSHVATVRPEIKTHFPDQKLTEINGMLMDGEDTFWICTSMGLLKYNLTTGSINHYFLAAPSLHLISMRPDPKLPNILWLGSYGDGLIRFDKNNGKAIFFVEKGGLPNNTIYAILPDSNGLLWCSSNKGIFSFNPGNYHVNQYIPQGDVPLVEFNRLHYFAFPDGRFAFGGTDGYTAFKPQDLKEDWFKPRVALTGVLVNNQPLDEQKQPLNTLNSLSLSYRQNFLSFEFSALQFNIPEKLRYRYRLLGLDESWVMAGNTPIATYTAVAPGSYSLWINASNTSGRWSPYIRKIAITIHPPFWLTWWFIAAASLSVAMLIFFSLRYRLRRIRKKDQEKMAFERETMELEAQALRSQMNPHFIFNCLNSIKSLIILGDREKAVNYLSTFSVLIRNQLNNHLQEISLQEELDTCLRYLELEALRFGDKISYHLATDPDVDLSRIQVPPLLIQPFIENAVIHGILPMEGSGHIGMRIEKGGNEVLCFIEDNGIGRRQSALLKGQQKLSYRSKGLRLVEQRIKLHNTLNRFNIDITIEDKLDEQQRPAGTLVILTFKLKV